MISFEDTTSGCNGSSDSMLEVVKEGMLTPRRRSSSSLNRPLPISNLELVPDSPRKDGSALGSFMIHLLNDAISISDRQDDDDVDDAEKSAAEYYVKEACDVLADIDACDTTGTSKSASNKNDQFIVISDNARLPFQEDQLRKFEYASGNTSPKRGVSRRYSERAEMKRETRWSSLNARNPTSAGLTLPLRRNSSIEFDYANLPMPKNLAGRQQRQLQGALDASPKSSEKKSAPTDTIPTYPRSRRRSSA
ncbi:MAG: hypothetical protein SGILL_001713 [Bacillariaceae sp.]